MTQVPEDNQPVPGAPTIEGYTIMSEVGRGGFATVYAAEQSAVGGRVAIKVINTADTDGDSLLRFGRESQAMGTLRGHPNIVTVLDAGRTDDDRPYLVMELLESGSLHGELVRRKGTGDGPLEVSRVMDIGVKVASAVNAAHRAGILHRDLKPGNILLSDYGEPLLTDFGIARLADHDASVFGQALSAGFTAPEIIAGEQPTAASDIFSLGCTLHTLLSGQSPFRRSDDPGLLPALNRTVEEPAPDLRPLGIPTQLCDVLDKALAKRPDDRFADVAAFGQALQQVQELLGLPVTTAPLPTGEVDAVAGDLGNRTVITNVGRELGPATVPPPPPVAVVPAPAPAPSAAPAPAPAIASAPVPHHPVAPPSPQAVVATTADRPPPPGGRSRPRWLAMVLVVIGLLTLGAIGALVALRLSGPPNPEGGPQTQQAFEEANPLLLTVDDVQIETEAVEADDVALFFAEWGAAINEGRIEDAYAFLGPDLQSEDPLDAYLTEWEGAEVRDMTLLDIVPFDGGLDVDLRFRVSEVADPVTTCLEYAEQHTLDDSGDGFEIFVFTITDGPLGC